MSREIDCLLVGYNELNFKTYESIIRGMGEETGNYRDLGFSFIWLNGEPHCVPDVFNKFYCKENSIKPVMFGETFNAAIAYLCTYLKQRKFSYDFVNTFQDQKSVLKKKLTEDNLLLVGISTTFYFTPFPIMEIVKFIREHNPDVKIVVGGPYVTTQTRVLQSDSELSALMESIGADYYINSSQGEATLVNLIDSLKHGLPVGNVKNVYYKNGRNYIYTGTEIEDNKLEENTVNWDLFREFAGEHAIVRTSISCPFSCSFCGFPEHAGEYQYIGAEVLEKELNQLNNIESIKYINFVDDTFNVPIKRFKEILGMIIKNNYKFQWTSHFRCQFADEETVKLMKESGCIAVYMGLESGNDIILKNMNKGVTVDKYRRGLALLKKYDITTAGSFIVGFPGETVDTVEDTMNLINEGMLDFFRAHVWYLWQITPIWRKRDKFGIEGANYDWKHKKMDWKTACDLVENMVLSIDKSIWVPQHNFDFENIVHLLSRGMDLNAVKRFLKAFNTGLRERLADKTKRNVSEAVLNQIKNSCNYNGRYCDKVDKNMLYQKYEANFSI
jgi:anaerobic magnesium-protoporphyrin IX monomethyl ester cyclase